MPLNTLYGYWTHATQLLQAVADAILSTVLAAPIVGVDDTRLDYIEFAPPCLSPIEPYGGWQATALALNEDVAVTVIQALDRIRGRYGEGAINCGNP